MRVATSIAKFGAFVEDESCRAAAKLEEDPLQRRCPCSMIRLPTPGRAGEEMKIDARILERDFAPPAPDRCRRRR